MHNNDNNNDDNSLNKIIKGRKISSILVGMIILIWIRRVHYFCPLKKSMELDFHGVICLY